MSEYQIAMIKRNDDQEGLDRFSNLARETFDRDAGRMGMLAGEMRVCHGSFDFDAGVSYEWPPLPPGATPAYIAFCEFRHPGSV